MKTSNRRPWRSNLQLSIRAFLVLVLLLGCWLGWFVRTANLQRNAVAAVKKARGFVWYDWEWKNGDYVQGKWEPAGPKWLVERIGVDYFSNVTFVNIMRASDEDLTHIEHLGRLENRKKAETYRFNGHPSLDARSIHPVTIAKLESQIAALEAKLADPNDPDDKKWTAGWSKRYETELVKKRKGLALRERERTNSRPAKQPSDETVVP